MEPENVAIAQKRPRKRSRVVVEAKMKEHPRPKNRKKAGSLGELPNMPLDILFEIFGHLPPYDLLKLARTDKAFRRLLLNKSSIIIWKTALNRVPDLPPCPPEMSEPAWTNLAFSPHCHFCLTYTRNVLWYLRIRSCSHCAHKNLEDVNSLFLRHSDWIPKHHLRQFVKVVPTEPRKSLCNPKSLLELEAEYLTVPEDNRGPFLEEQERKSEEKRVHAELCKYWAKKQSTTRELELCSLRADRAAAVVSKLEELGWGDDIRALPHGALANQKLVDRPQRLTEKIWQNIKNEVLEFMEDMRTLRLEKELEQVVLRRKRPAVEFLKAFKKSKLHGNQLMPDCPDFCNFEPVKEVLCQPVGVDVDVSSFEFLLPQLPSALARWREELRESLVPLLPFPKKRTTLKRSGQLELATTVFQCNECSITNEDFAFTPPLLFYPQVLGHRCLTHKIDYWAPETVDGSIRLIPEGILIHKRWSANSLDTEPGAHKIAKEFVELAGLNPLIATVKDMDQLDLRFICQICRDGSVNAKRRYKRSSKAIVSLWTWRAVITHHYVHHSATSFDRISKWYEVIRELPEEVKYEELTNQEAVLALWSCLRCSDTPSETSASLVHTKNHLAELHNIESPTIYEDYFKIFAAEDIEATRPPFWVCWEEGSTISVAAGNKTL